MKKIIFVSISLICLFFAIAVCPVTVDADEISGELNPGLQTGIEGILKSAPTASPAAGTYTSTQSVTLTAVGATSIRYTTDGTTPVCSTSSSLYSSAISITSTKTVKAISCYPNSNTSSVSSSTYTLVCATASVSNGTVSAYPTCAITCNSGYTLSGSSCVAVSTGGGGGGGGDVAAPAISNITVTTLADNYAVISWKTNESSLSWINYGTSTSYGLTSKTLVYISSHSLKLTDLSTSTVYHYQVKSQDTTGNIGSYTDKTFTTLSTGAAPVTVTPTTPTPITPITPITPTPTIQPVPYVSPKTVAEMQANLNVLLQNLAVIQAQVKAISAVPAAPTVVPPTAIPSAGRFITGLYIGVKNDDVRALQEFLKAQGSDIYPEGLVTGYFGNLTRSAVQRFQLKYGIVADSSDPGYGYVGPKTRAQINKLLGL